MEAQTTTTDVAIVGYGPVGQILALLLARAGRQVVVLERQQASYYLPRAVHFDDEAGRIFQSVGLAPDTMTEAVQPYDDFYEWRSRDRSTLTRLDWRGLGPSGWNVSNFFNQPALERALDEQLRALPNVDIRYGSKVTSFDETADNVTLLLETGSTEDLLTAKYVIGADGANSTVRDWIGSSVTDLGYFHDWLVVDLRMLEEVDGVFDPPAWQLCDPARPTTLVPGGPGRRRFEFMRLPDEDSTELTSPKRVWELLEPWGIDPDNAELERSVVYTFQARWSDQWNRGRLLIAGDAAHLMPPFAGQGMCSGLRDAVNLAWKLDLVLTGAAHPQLLDSFGSERRDHVRDFINASMDLGAVICVTDEAAAEERDASMKDALASGATPAPRPLPKLGPGVHDTSPGAGQLSVQGILADSERREHRFDDVFGGGWTLYSLDDATESVLAVHPVTEVLKIRFVKVSRTMLGMNDDHETYIQWLAGLGARAALVRPDFYIYGSIRGATEVDAMLDSLQAFLDHSVELTR